MIILFSLIVITGMAVSYFWYQKKNTPIDNRYRKNAKKIMPTLADHPSIDDDTVLGLKKTICAEQSSEAPSTPSTGKVPPIVLYLMAPEGTVYGGYELLQALLSTGLRYGQHQIFHRHEHKEGHGDVLFHCASAEKPGIFDPSHMGNFTTRGLCFFFSVDNNHDPLSTFDLLLDTLDQLIEDLGGLVHNDQHQVFTKENMVKYRQRIRGIENRQTTADLFAEI